MSQTSYSMNQGIARDGLLADIGENDVLSRIADAVVGFGKVVSRGANADLSCKVPSLATDISDQTKILGVALETQAIESHSGGDVDGEYLAQDAVSVLHKGRVYVKVEEAVTPASPVFVRFAAGAGGTELGSFRASADTATAEQVDADKARYLSSAGAGEFAVVEVDL